MRERKNERRERAKWTMERRWRVEKKGRKRGRGK
jgi:hypothetical protein